MRLTARRAVSCYGVSGWPNRGAGDGSCENGPGSDGWTRFLRTGKCY